jgi:haloalkane dehalogenase
MVMAPELRSLYPFQSHFFETKGHRLHYVDEGLGDPILCLHGNPTWSFYFRNIIREFRKTQRVIAPDHLGCGLSDKPQEASYTLEKHIDRFESLVLHLNLQNITLIVHDWGGAIGLGFVMRHRSRIKRLILLNTAAFLSKDIPKRIDLLRSFSDLLIRRANLFCLAANFMTSVKPLPKAVKQAYLYPYTNYHDRVAIAGFVKDIPLRERDISYRTLESIEKSLPSLQVPTLLLWGAKDFCFHMGFFKTWKTLYPESKDFVFENAGHYVLEDESVACIEKIREFLIS